MTQFRPQPLPGLFALLICTMIAAGSAEAKDIDAQPDKSSDDAPAATGTPKTRTNRGRTDRGRGDPNRSKAIGQSREGTRFRAENLCS